MVSTLKEREREGVKKEMGALPPQQTTRRGGRNSKCGRRKTFQSESDDDDDDDGGGGVQTQHGKAPGGQAGELKRYGDTDQGDEETAFCCVSRLVPLTLGVCGGWYVGTPMFDVFFPK